MIITNITCINKTNVKSRKLIIKLFKIILSIKKFPKLTLLSHKKRIVLWLQYFNIRTKKNNNNINKNVKQTHRNCGETYKVSKITIKSLHPFVNFFDHDGKISIMMIKRGS